MKTRPALPLALLLLSATPALPQTPALQFREQDGRLYLDYAPGFSTGGVTMLQFSDDAATLESTPAAGLFNIPAAAAGPISWDVTAHRTGSRGFFSIVEFPGLNSADFDRDEDEPGGPEIFPDYELEALTGLSYPLATGTALPVHFRLLDGRTGVPVPLNGSVRLSLRTGDEQPVAFPYTLAPNSLPMTAGVVNGTVTLSTAGQMDGVWLDVVEIIPAGAAAPRDVNNPTIANGGTTGLQQPALGQYLNTNPGWHYPLPTHAPLVAPAPINGTFGEWRPTDSGGGDATSGRHHGGLDFRATPGTEVYPVNRGVVSVIRPVPPGNLGKYIVVIHGDGTASRYLHVDPVARVDQVVDTTTILGRVAGI